jgi:dihydropteroate synthase
VVIDHDLSPPRLPWLHHPWWTADGLPLAGEGRPRIMAILNVTPDSFSDGGHNLDPRAAVEQALQLEADGADILDIGGESTRPGAESVPDAEELRRVVPVIAALNGRLRIPISIDTSKAAVAREAIAAGAVVVNDVTALSGDQDMAQVVADSGAAVVLMHAQGTPQTMQINPHYTDVVAEVDAYLAERLDFAQAHGIPRDRIALDPGIGFGKTNTHSLTLLRHLQTFTRHGSTVLIGTSRKGFLGKLTGREVHERQPASTASALAAFFSGAAVARVHEPGPLADALAVWQAQSPIW